ncbi:Phytoene/squalene synthetase [Sphingobacterium nematocida]|uniref:Phytoene/squalene synthetase n=1 Tax=Sphingobacterium nematocida TaxID=1513896 RepID=A0A1T5F5G2_9SPHI|nr:phytoene/squalene synthase family protein [Sphingobacterium nematocida]SKB91424.1 Phytoene/squalene synthetase [Sphingobacterium nematocida]
MKKIFDDLSSQVSKITTERYSTSFSLGILALDASIRPAIYAIYGYVRLADEIVDSFHGYDKKQLLQRLIKDTDYALKEKISLNPILNAFQASVHSYSIDRALVDRFLASMAMDLEPMSYNDQRYKDYIVGSAEVVGLMCLQVFVKGNQQHYEELMPYAMRLGAAFQKINFLRDMREDYFTLGRIYFPNLEMEKFDDRVKASIESDIKNDFTAALVGIKKLPSCARFGVYLAYRYYCSLFNKIHKMSASDIMSKRVRIPNGYKLSIMMESYFKYKAAVL